MHFHFCPNFVLGMLAHRDTHTCTVDPRSHAPPSTNVALASFASLVAVQSQPCRMSRAAVLPASATPSRRAMTGLAHTCGDRILITRGSTQNAACPRQSAVATIRACCKACWDPRRSCGTMGSQADQSQTSCVRASATTVRRMYPFHSAQRSLSASRGLRRGRAPPRCTRRRSCKASTRSHRTWPFY